MVGAASAPQPAARQQAAVRGKAHLTTPRAVPPRKLCFSAITLTHAPSLRASVEDRRRRSRGAEQVIMAAQPVSAAATAATPALEGGASRQYWGRAGRAALWADINTDEYAQGQLPGDDSVVFLRQPWEGLKMLAGALWSAVTRLGPGFGGGPAIASVFTAQGQCVRADRTKIFHALGIHRLASYTALPDNGVTGLLAEADVPLLLRLSVAHRQDGLVPGVAATWFPEDAAPGSMVLFPTMDSDPGQRFFGHDFLHVLPPTKQLQANILRGVLAVARPGGNTLSVDHLAAVDIKGRRVAAPTMAIFMMLRAPKNLDQPMNGRDFRDMIKEVTRGQTLLLEVHVRDSSGDKQIGTINLDPKDDWKTSVGGDRRLFFPHAAASFGAVLRGLVGGCPVAKKAS